MMSADDIRVIVREVLAEQSREMDEELKADFAHLRRWRKSVEQAQSYTFKTIITVIVGGFLGAIWMGVKVMLGK